MVSKTFWVISSDEPHDDPGGTATEAFLRRAQDVGRTPRTDSADGDHLAGDELVPNHHCVELPRDANPRIVFDGVCNSLIFD